MSVTVSSPMRRFASVAVALVAGLLTSVSHAGEYSNWVARSNAHANVVLEILAKYNPEGAGALGVDGLDEKIIDLKADRFQRFNADVAKAREELARRLEKETHALVRQDLEILLKATDDTLKSNALTRAHLIPYNNVAQTVFQGIRALIDDQIPAERYPAAVVRLRRYAGLEDGYEPLTELAKANSAERFAVEGLQGPFRGQVEQDLQRAGRFIEGLEQLFIKADVKGWEKPYRTLKSQLEDYERWLREEMLARARDDYRLPPELYADALHNWGVDAAPDELIAIATQGFADIKNEMIALAPLVAAEHGFDSADYRDVIRELKKQQIPADQILPFYRKVLSELEARIEENDLVSLPEREAGIRIASDAETAAQPAPHLDIPRLMGNTGEYPNFVLPKLDPATASQGGGHDDNYEAGAWTLTAHEARPGHELQFSAMIEGGVSYTRAVFAFNSANVEGWALYAEAIIKPYMPLDAQLIGLQYRLARAARMFLDPMLNLGLITPEEAKAVLTDEVVLGEAWAQNEIERYTYRIPGQATAYYYGYTKLQSLRTRTELKLRDRFDAKAFHDFILAQGLLPPELLEQAVMETFVPSQAPAQTASAR